MIIMVLVLFLGLSFLMTKITFNVNRSSANRSSHGQHHYHHQCDGCPPNMRCQVIRGEEGNGAAMSRLLTTSPIKIWVSQPFTHHDDDNDDDDDGDDDDDDDGGGDGDNDDDNDYGEDDDDDDKGASQTKNTGLFGSFSQVSALLLLEQDAK